MAKLDLPDKMRVIYNDVAFPAPAEPAGSVRARLGFRQEEFLALSIATLRPEKTALLFVSAVQRAHRVDPRVRGLVVGGGPEQERLKALAGVDGVVQVLGRPKSSMRPP